MRERRLSIWRRVSGTRSALWILVVVTTLANAAILVLIWIGLLQLHRMNSALDVLNETNTATQAAAESLRDHKIKLECADEPQVYGGFVSTNKKLVCEEKE